nr:hypothetical protein [Tanacetum cinerariifolium]
MNERCLTILLNKLLSKEKDPGSFTIPCDIGHLHINNALADLGSSISLMPYTMYEKLGLGEPKLTKMSLELADRSIQYLRGIAKSVLIKIDKFILPIDFVILDMGEDSKILIILGRPFLATARAMIDVFNKKITLGVGNEEELLEDGQLDSFLVINLEKSIDISDLESCGINIKIKDKKGAENLVVDHLSRLENPNIGELAEDKIADKFTDEHLMILKAKLNEEEPWNYFWDEPYAFRLCPDNAMRRCMAGDKILEILVHCHSGPTGGHHNASIAGRKVYEARFYWPSIFAKD